MNDTSPRYKHPMTQQGQAYIGTSGYQYKHWRGPFYPEHIPQEEWFAHYTRHFRTVEINNTFYHLPEASTFKSWRKNAPPGFCYTLKFSRYGSHLKCLRSPEDTIGRFLERAHHLGPHLGPILVQLKPNWHLNLQRLRHFLQAAPRSHRWAFEFRDPSWLCEEVFDVLREHNAALCIHDMLADHPYAVTTNWVYLRFHGDHYAGSYSHQFLSARARRIVQHLANGQDVYAYFNNDAQGHAAQNALALQRYIQA